MFTFYLQRTFDVWQWSDNRNADASQEKTTETLVIWR